MELGSELLLAEEWKGMEMSLELVVYFSFVVVLGFCLVGLGVWWWWF